MNKRQINKTRMYFATDLVLDNHLGLITTFSELTDAHQSLKDKLALIDVNRQVQEANSSGLTINKTKLREDLTHLIKQFSAALVAYATSTKKNELRKKASYSDSSLIRAADPILIDIGALLLKLATPLKPEVQRFFISQVEFDAMEAVLTSFRSAIPQKRIATGTSKVSTLNIGDTFNAIDLMLKEELDVLMLPFQFTQIDFYHEYKSARIIVDTGGNRKKKEETLIDD